MNLFLLQTQYRCVYNATGFKQRLILIQILAFPSSRSGVHHTDPPNNFPAMKLFFFSFAESAQSRHVCQYVFQQKDQRLSASVAFHTWVT